MSKLRYICDRARHIVCLPYSVENLHIMAQELRLSRGWFHDGRWPHYDMPLSRMEELFMRCEIVSSRDILNIIRTGQMATPRLPRGSDAPA